MSGFTRDSRYYGDRLVYEALLSKWSRYHARCRCGNNWITQHAEPAGFTVVRRGSGFVALTGPGLTEDVDESRLTANALWEAVTGEKGTQAWFEPVRTIDRSEKAEAARKTAAPRPNRQPQARTTTTKNEPITDKQLRYLTTLITKASKDRFNAEFAAAIKGTTVKPRGPQERTMQAVKRLTKPAARKLITGLLT
ncbi:hypothetical protein ACFSZT_28295 [Prauserella oleivorans]|uniref:hypothetical protein n=1 Tax=Prauserella oleivorans TaxID=1478153 RepID=UPI00362EDDCB